MSWKRRSRVIDLTWFEESQRNFTIKIHTKTPWKVEEKIDHLHWNSHLVYNTHMAHHTHQRLSKHRKSTSWIKHFERKLSATISVNVDDKTTVMVQPGGRFEKAKTKITPFSVICLINKTFSKLPHLISDDPIAPRFHFTSKWINFKLKFTKEKERDKHEIPWNWLWKLLKC